MSKAALFPRKLAPYFWFFDFFSPFYFGSGSKSGTRTGIVWITVPVPIRSKKSCGFCGSGSIFAAQQCLGPDVWWQRRGSPPPGSRGQWPPARWAACRACAVPTARAASAPGPGEKMRERCYVQVCCAVDQWEAVCITWRTNCGQSGLRPTNGKYLCNAYRNQWKLECCLHWRRPIVLINRNQCCGSGMFIPDPDFYPSRIQKQQQKRVVKKNLLSYLFL